VLHGLSGGDDGSIEHILVRRRRAS
jgi:hypothetical protein